MSSLLAPSGQQLVSALDTLLEREPDARLLGMRSPVRRPWPEAIERRGQRFQVVWCESALEVREALSGLEQGDGARLLVMTPLDDVQLGPDIAARLPQARLKTASRWDALRSAFRARDLDPRLRGQGWLCDLLVERVPGDGYPPVPGGVLDLDTAWRSCLLHVLGLQDGHADAGVLLEWTTTEGSLERFQAIPPTARAQLLEKLATQGGAAAALVSKAIAAGQGADALAVGLVCGIVFASGSADLALREAAVRLEPMIGGNNIAPEAGSTLAEAARKVLVRMEGNRALEAQARAEAILASIKAADFAALSPALTVGLDTRIAAAAVAALKAAGSDSAQDADHVIQLVRRTLEHDRAREHKARLDRLQMAARLSRWLVSRRRAVASFASAVKAYVDDGGFVDWARQVLLAGDGLPEVATAYSKLRELARERREEENKAFAELLADWNSSGAAGDEALPIERVLDTIVAPLASHAPILLLILDGLSFAVARPLVADVARLGWTELAPSGRTAAPAVVAALPTITEISRMSLFAGSLTRGDAGAERTAFASHSKLRQVSRAGRPPVLFHKAHLGAGPELDEQVRSAIADTGQKVVGVVHNAVDSQLAGSDQIDVSWSADTLRQLSALLRAARESGRLVILTGDHGHVIEAGTSLSQGGTGDRWRAGSEAHEGEIEVRGGRLLAPNGARGAVLAWSERVRYAAKRSGYHGGASPQEVLIPLTILTGATAPRDWVEAPPAEPSWWAERSGLPLEPPQKPQTQGKGRDAQQPGLFDRPMPTEAWIEAIFVTSTYAAQKAIAGRGAPEDGQVRKLVSALATRGGRLSRTTLAQALGVPAFRAAGIVNAARRLLNVDQAQVLSIDSVGDEVVLDVALLRYQFQLGETP
jgi:hypothetical protein